jgi:hypothetical protein
MGSKREHLRVSFENPCILTHDGISYLGLLENLSPSGAFVKVAGKCADELLFIGDIVALKLCINPESNPVECFGTVIRLDSAGLGVIFEK